MDVWLLPPVLLLLSGAVAAVLVPGEARLAVIWCAGVAAAAVAAATAAAVRRGRAATAAERRVAANLKESMRLATEVLPAATTRIRQGELPDNVLPHIASPPGTDPMLAAAHSALLRTVSDAVQDREYQRDSARRAIVNIACRIQAEVHRLQDDLNKMQFRHGSPEVLGDLMHLEHGINVAGRVATSLAVLGGGSPVRQWQKPVSLYDVLRAGSAPINDYLRVEQHRVTEVAVVGPAVEPIILVLAELLDNSTRYSPPSTSVIMNTEEVASGVEISIEDKGTGLTEEGRKRAEFLLTQAIGGLDLEDLGETARIGLRVAGILAHRHGLRVSLRPSTCDGVRAVVFVPDSLLTPLPMPQRFPRAGARPGPKPLPAGPRRDEEEPAGVERNANGLPQRRRRWDADSWEGPAARPSPTAPRVESGLWMSDFFATPDSGENSGTASDLPTSNESWK